MTCDTINDAQTIAGKGEGAFLANRYRIVRQLGSGGMGSVWLAEDTQLDNKPFAIKMLPSILVTNKRAYAQLKAEALVAMKLVHPNIVQIRAFEENDGNPFLVMDYIDGQTLDDYLAENGKLSEEDVIRVLHPIAAALDYAHSQGVVHRDVKPANVMIRKDGTPFILDFGIAREIQETMTRVTGKLSSGTLLYMSPEQLMGEKPTPAQDIYSFAAMAYECLKGEPPFSHGQIEFQIMNKVPEALVGASVPLARSVMAGLAKKPEDRPATCAAVLKGNSFSRVEHVERVEGDGRAVSMKPPPVESRIPPSPGLRRMNPRDRSENSGAGKVFAVLALLAALAGGAWLYHQHQEQQREQARIVAAQKAEAERRADEARKAKEEAERLRREEEVRKAEEERKREVERQTREKAEAELKAAEERARLVAEAAARKAATEIRIEAKVLMANVERISDADGFKEKKDVLAGSFARADALFDEKVRRWSEAAVLFTNYVTECKALIALDGERQKEVAKRAEEQAALRRAQEAEREKQRLAEIEKEKRLREERKRREEERLAAEKRAEEERTRAEARRIARQSLPGRWTCTTKHSTSYGLTSNIKYEYDFRADGSFTFCTSAGALGDNSTTTTQGHWSLSGNTLKLRYSGSSVRLPDGSVRNFEPKVKSFDCHVLWRENGTFEMRWAKLDWSQDGNVNRISYGADGTERRHIKTKGGFFTPSQEFDEFETAKVFRRIQ